MATIYDKPKEILESYFNFLSSTGYVSQQTVFRLMIYLCLLDVSYYVGDIMESEDVETMRLAIRHLFRHGDCLMPYTVDEIGGSLVKYTE